MFFVVAAFILIQCAKMFPSTIKASDYQFTRVPVSNKIISDSQGKVQKPIFAQSKAFKWNGFNYIGNRFNNTIVPFLKNTGLSNHMMGYINNHMVYINNHPVFNNPYMNFIYNPYINFTSYYHLINKTPNKPLLVNK